MLIKQHCNSCGSKFFIGNNQTPTIYMGDKPEESYFRCPYCETKISLTLDQITTMQKRM